MKDGGHVLISAQGAVREGAQAIDNFMHLLGSRRVGPRVIGGALIDVRESCSALSSALVTLDRELRDLLCADADASAIAQSLLRQALACVQQLEAELNAVKKVDLDARARLSVEGVVRASSQELAPLLFLVDLLACAATPRLSQLDARDLLHGQAITPGRSGGPKMRAAGTPERLTFLGDARLVGGLMLVSLSIVARASGGMPRVEASPLSGELLQVRISAAPVADAAGGRPPSDPGLMADIPAYAAASEGQTVAHAVARLSGIGFSVAASEQEVTLEFGRTSASGD